MQQGNKINFRTQLEKFLNSDKTSTKITKVVLAILAIGGVLIITAMAPNIFQIFGKYRRSKRYSGKQFRNALYTLKRRGFIQFMQEKDNKIKVKITKKGKEKIKEFSIDELTIPKPKKWDKKWRIVIFDIPNKFNKARTALREKIKELGFFQLQKSAWVYPYHCEDEILFVAGVFNVGSFIEILTVENLLREEKLKRFFNL